MSRGIRNVRSPIAVVVAALVALAFVGVAAPAGAQGGFVDDVAAEMERDGYSVEDGAEIGAAAAASLAEDLAGNIGFVVLASGVTPTAQAFADDLYAVLQSLGSPIDGVIVVTPDELGAVASDRYGADAASMALDATDPDDDAEAIVRDYARALRDIDITAEPTDTGTPVAESDGPAATSDGGGGGAGILIFLLVVVVIGVGIVWFMKRSASTLRAKNLAKARAEVDAQITALGSLVYDLDDRVQLSDSDAARRRYDQASSDFADLNRAIDEADSGPEVADVASRVDDVKWALEAVEAELDGRPLPPKPTEVDLDASPSPLPGDDRSAEPAGTPRRRGPDLGPLGTSRPSRRGGSRRSTIPGGDVSGVDRSTACFFDPSHRSGTVPVSIETARGEMAAFICRDCSRRLEAGERPTPRLLDVGDRKVAAAAAPTGYGGLGLSLPDLFNIRTGSMSEGVDIDWRREVDRPSSAGADRRRRRTEALPGRSTAGRKRGGRR